MNYTCGECFERLVCSKCHKQICKHSNFIQGCLVNAHYKLTSTILTKRISPLLCADCKVEKEKMKK